MEERGYFERERECRNCVRDDDDLRRGKTEEKEMVKREEGGEAVVERERI